jgi:hypothetical protein
MGIGGMKFFIVSFDMGIYLAGPYNSDNSIKRIYAIIF